MEHLLLHCVRTRVLWELLFSLFGIMWGSPNTVGDTLLERCLCRQKKENGVASGTFLLVLEG